LLGAFNALAPLVTVSLELLTFLTSSPNPPNEVLRFDRSSSLVLVWSHKLSFDIIT
jgi:hypothetical protein